MIHTRETDIINYQAALGADFGSITPVEVVRRGLLKVVCGWHNGSTVQGILLHHALVKVSKGGNFKVTHRGRLYLREILGNMIGEG